MSAINNHPLLLLHGIEPLLPDNASQIRDRIVSSIYQHAEEISSQVVSMKIISRTGQLIGELILTLYTRWVKIILLKPASNINITR